MGFVDDIEKKWGDNEIKSIVNDVMQIAENRAKFEYAPRGATNSLRDGIVTSKAFKIGNDIQSVIISQAINKNENYALIQHDVERRHASPPGQHDVSFADHGDEGSTFDRYWQGYKKLIKQGRFYKYATEYLDKALESVEDLLDKELAAL